MRKISITVIILTFALLLSSCGLIEINKPGQETTAETIVTTEDDFGETDPPMSVESQSPPYIPDPQEWAARESEADSMLSGTVNIKYDGSTLFIVDATDTFSSPLVENNVYSEALYKRNEKLLSKHGFKVTVSSADAATLFEDYKSTIASGNTYCDLLSVPISDTGMYITSGLIKNLRTLAFFDPKASYTIPSFSSSSCGGDDSFFAVGYASLTPSDLSAVYFNKEILSKHGIDLYGDILGGTFTIERYAEILRVTEASSVISPSLDIGLISLVGAGLSPLESGHGVKVSASVDKVKSVITGTASYMSHLLYASVEDITAENEFSVFEEGKSVFRVGVLSDVDKIYDDKVIWGIAPMPKSDATAGYVTPVNSSVACLMITSNTTKAEMCSVALGSINAASYKWLLDSAILHYAAYRIPDAKSFEAMKLIIENPVLDFSAVASSLTDKFDSVIYESIRAYSADSSFDLSKAITSSTLKTVTTPIKKYFS